ncbi:hypothetical protein DFH08DRAFT_1049765 [Mycena albidolilacea]|uniref:Uncharacterized protein n=1 Tax=Mycena albidolilacea TaxID=1033008 RepID=A0AAD7EBD4_9AGAR|nr:hypothetical protein DFH08DRAFT_1049765 [Mycena albidolilacea]
MRVNKAIRVLESWIFQDIPVAEAVEALESKSWIARPGDSFPDPFLVPQRSGIPACLPGATNEHVLTRLITLLRVVSHIFLPSTVKSSMDQPSWNDTLRATLGACVPCLTCRSNAAANPSGDSDDEYSNSNGVRGVRRARADELEGLLADAHSSNFGNSGDDGWRDRDDDAAADADAISLHSHLGPRGRRRAPPRTPKHISLWGFNVFGRARGVALEGGDDALHARPHPPAAGDAAAAGKRTKRRGAQHSTDDLLARAALDAGPTQLKDVSAADVARRARSGSAASQGHAETPVESDHERRARRKVRKEMRRLAAALAEAPHTPTEFEGFPGSGELPSAPHKGIPAPFLHLSASGPAPDALAQLQAADDEDAADLDGLAYARLAPRPMGGSQSQSRSSGRSSGSGSGAPYSPVGGTCYVFLFVPSLRSRLLLPPYYFSFAFFLLLSRSPFFLLFLFSSSFLVLRSSIRADSSFVSEVAYVGMPKPKKSKSKSRRSTKSKSSATSSTLASPPPTSPSFPHGVRDSPLRDSGVEFGAFASGTGGAEDEFDGTPGGFDSSFGVEAEAEAEPEVPREALPSPGLSRGAGGFRFGGGGGKGMGGF